MKDKKARADKEYNQLKVKESFLELIKELNRRPTVDEVCKRSGLSDKVVRNGLKAINFDKLKSPLRILTDDVLIKLYQRATGYEHEAVKIFPPKATKKTKKSKENKDGLEEMDPSAEPGLRSEKETKAEMGEAIIIPYTEHYPPDAAAAKLWFQIVEGWTEKQEHKHTGQVKVTAPPVTLKIQRGGKITNEGTEAE